MIITLVQLKKVTKRDKPEAKSIPSGIIRIIL